MLTSSPSAQLFRPVVLVLAVIGAALLIGLTGCGNSPQPTRGAGATDEETGPPWFEDVTNAVGLDFVHDPGPTDTFFMPQSMGSGCAFFDFDGDGRLDIYLLHQGGPGGKKNQLFQQQADGAFKDVSQGSGLTSRAIAPASPLATSTTTVFPMCWSRNTAPSSSS